MSTLPSSASSTGTGLRSYKGSQTRAANWEEHLGRKATKRSVPEVGVAEERKENKKNYKKKKYSTINFNLRNDVRVSNSSGVISTTLSCDIRI